MSEPKDVSFNENFKYVSLYNSNSFKVNANDAYIRYFAPSGFFTAQVASFSAKDPAGKVFYPSVLNVNLSAQNSLDFLFAAILDANGTDILRTLVNNVPIGTTGFQYPFATDPKFIPLFYKKEQILQVGIVNNSGTSYNMLYDWGVWVLDG